MRDPLTEEMMLASLKDLTEKLGRVPKRKDVGRHNGVPSIYSYEERFGSLENALLVMRGRADEIELKHTKEELIAALRAKAEKLEKRVTPTDVLWDFAMPPLHEYTIAFGGLNSAFRAAELPAPFPTRETLLEDFRREARRLGYTPSRQEVNESPRTHSATTYIRYIGNLTDVAIAAGVRPNGHGDSWRRRRMNASSQAQIEAS